MRSGWKREPLGKVCQFLNRGISPKYLDQGGIRVINQKCVRNHVIDYELARRHDEKTKKVLGERLLQPGDVLINSTGTGTLGRVAQVREQPSEPTTVDSHVTIVRPIKGKFYLDFFGHLLVSIEEKIKEGGEGCGGQTELARSKLASDYWICFPEDLNEQKRIAEILDKAFFGIEQAKANFEKNLKNTREFFQSCLQEVFDREGVTWSHNRLEKLCETGRIITYGVVKLGNEFSNGIPCLRTSNVRWLSIDRAGVKNIEPALSKSYSRTILKGGEVLVNVRGTLGGVCAVPSDMKGWNISREVAVVPVDSKKINSEFLAFWIGSQKSQNWLTSVKKGAAYTGINIEDLRNLPVFVPSLKIQKNTVQHLTQLYLLAKDLEKTYQKKIYALDELKTSILEKAFTGELETEINTSNIVSFPILLPDELHMGTIAYAYRKHEGTDHLNTYRRTKSEKIIHLIEYQTGLDLGRQAIPMARGPYDKEARERVETQAKAANYFECYDTTKGVALRRLKNFDLIAKKAEEAFGDKKVEIDRIIELFLPMNHEDAEVPATVYAAWNNLLIDGEEITDDKIVKAAREEWHVEKTNIPRNKFVNAIAWLRKNNLVPTGQGKRVGERPLL